MILSDARELLYEVVVPTIDNEENVAAFNRYINLVSEHYINSGKWNGMIREIALTAGDGYFTLPPRFVAALAAKNCMGCPLSIANRWFAYRYASYCMDDFATWTSFGYGGVQDMGDGFTTFLDSPYASYYLRFTRATIEDAGMQVLVKGSDSTGTPVFSLSPDNVSYEGATITLTNVVTTTTQAFSGRLDYLQKRRSRGYLALDAVDTITGATTRIGYYAPSETTPCYHRYWMGCDACDSVIALCKIRYTPAIVDSDEVIPGNARALRAGLAALKCEKEGDVTRRDAYFADGLKILSDEMRETRGGARFGLRIDATAFQFARLWQGR